MAETSTKPYLVRALYEWCCDNGYTPYLAVSVDSDTIVPRQYVRNGEIVLNVSPAATHQLLISNERIEFQARFSGVAQGLSIPVGNVTAIYARETGHGMAFEVTRTAAPGPADAGDANDELAQRRQGSSGPAQADGRRRDGTERAEGERGRAGRPPAGDGQPGESTGAEVIAFGPDAARRRRRDGGGRGPERADRAERSDSSDGVAGDSAGELGHDDSNSGGSNVPADAAAGSPRGAALERADGGGLPSAVEVLREGRAPAREDRTGEQADRADASAAVDAPAAVPIRPATEPTNLAAARAERASAAAGEDGAGTDSPGGLEGDDSAAPAAGQGEAPSPRREGGGRRRRGDRSSRARADSASAETPPTTADAAADAQTPDANGAARAAPSVGQTGSARNGRLGPDSGEADRSRPAGRRSDGAPTAVPRQASRADQRELGLQGGADGDETEPGRGSRGNPGRVPVTADAIDGGPPEPPDDGGSGGGGRRPRLTRVK